MWLPPHGFFPLSSHATHDRSAIGAAATNPRRPLLVIAFALLSVMAALLIPSAAHADSGLTLSTLDVRGQLVFFRITNGTNTLVSPTLTITGTGTDGSPIAISNLALGDIPPSESRATEVPLGVTPKSLQVTAATSISSVTSNYPLGQGQIQELGPDDQTPAPPDQGSSGPIYIVATLIALFFVLSTARVVFVSIKGGTPTRPAKVSQRTKFALARQQLLDRKREPDQPKAAPAPPTGQPIGARVPTSALTSAVVPAQAAPARRLAPPSPAKLIASAGGAQSAAVVTLDKPESVETFTPQPPPLQAPAPQRKAPPAGSPVSTTPLGQPTKTAPSGQPIGAAPSGQPIGAAPSGQPTKAAPSGQPIGAAPSGQPTDSPSATKAPKAPPAGKPIG